MPSSFIVVPTWLPAPRAALWPRRADVARALARAAVDLLAERTAVAVAVLDVDHPGDAGLDQRAPPVAGQGQRTHRRAVVAAVPADHLVAPGDQPRDLHRVLVGLGAAEREEHLGVARPGEREQSLGELDLGREHGVRRR